MKRFVQWYDSSPELIRLVFGAIAVAVPFYFSGLLGHQIAEVARRGGAFPLAAHATIFIVLAAIVVILSKVMLLARAQIEHEEEEYRTALMRAYTYTDQTIGDRLADMSSGPVTKENFVDVFCTSLQCIQRVVKATYNTFEAAFGVGLKPKDRVDFEVTFMTKSYVDDLITIPACSNRERRAPRSMLLRKNRPKIYDGTVTAQVYREARPSMHIIEDTADPDYSELYSGQKTRIRSSIVFPVLSDENALLGTLVVHCDKPGFFRWSEYKYWTDILEVFSKRIALPKARMDRLMELKKTAIVGVADLVPDAWF